MNSELKTKVLVIFSFKGSGNMHTYATDAKDRESVPLSLAALAVAATLLLNYILKVLNLQVPWWVDAPSVMGFYGVFYQLFD